MNFFDGIVAFESRSQLPRTSGVYVVFTNAETLYVGQSNSIYKRWRWRSHHRHTQFENVSAQVHIGWIEVGDSDVDTVEANLVKSLSPQFNDSPSPKTVVRLSQKQKYTTRMAVHIGLAESMTDFVHQAVIEKLHRDGYIESTG